MVVLRLLTYSRFVVYRLETRFVVYRLETRRASKERSLEYCLSPASNALSVLDEEKVHARVSIIGGGGW